jgi:hypothetical protein
LESIGGRREGEEGTVERKREKDEKHNFHPLKNCFSKGNQLEVSLSTFSKSMRIICFRNTVREYLF